MEPKPDFGETSYIGSGKLKGKAALITGGDSGIGRAVALAFAREGADVLISYLAQEEFDAQACKELIEREGRVCVAVPGDICEEAHCRKLVDTAVQRFGKLDILVNNAAFQMSHKDLGEISAEEFDRTFRTNVYANFFLCKAAVAHMKPGSAIISTASVNADKPNATLVAYAATKGAIQNMSGGMAQLLADKGHPRELRGARPLLDAADSFDHAAGQGEGVRHADAHEAPGPARRAAGGVRAAGVRPGELHLRRDHSGDGRRAIHLRRRRCSRMCRSAQAT